MIAGSACRGSAFDRVLALRWDQRARDGVLRYGLERLRRRRAGRFRVQHNPGRAQKELDDDRPLRDDNPVRMPFGTTLDFLQIWRAEPRQRLMELRLAGAPATVHVNHAPVLPRHFLLVPQPAARLPQVVTPAALVAADALLALSGAANLYCGFNSLGSWASVNHLHFQCVYYPDRVMPVAEGTLADGARRLRHCADGSAVWASVGYPLPHIVVTGPSAARRRRTMDAVAWLQEHGVPHTLLVDRDAARVFAKGRGRGALVTTGPGFFESGGELYVGDAEVYEGMDEEQVRRELAAGAPSEGVELDWWRAMEG